MADKKTYIRNPLTGRNILEGGQTHRKLIREGLFERDEVVDAGRVLAQAFADPKETARLIEQLNAELPPNEHAVHGRGVYKGRIVRRSCKQPLKGKARGKKKAPERSDEVRIVDEVRIAESPADVPQGESSASYDAWGDHSASASAEYEYISYSA